MKLFDRVASVTVGRSGETGITIRDLRINFEVVKTETSESNRCNITINNLSENTRNQIRADADFVAILKAGYVNASGEEVLFIGRIANVNHTVTPPDVITKITCEDGMTEFRTKRVSLSFAAGTTAKQAIKEIISQLGLPEKAALPIIPIIDKVFNNGYAFEGYAKDAMDELADTVQADWSVQNGEIKIVPREQTDKSLAIRLTPDSGLIGCPRRLKIQDKEETKKDETFDGWEVDTLLQPKAEPGGVVEIESTVISPAAQFKIVEVVHNGDTHGQQWKTTMKVQDIT